MVGGIADWFAVTALFRHPLGLPIPHTAIIPQQQGPDRRRARRFPAATISSPPRWSRGGCATSTSPARSAASSPSRPARAGCAQGGSRLLADILEALDQERLGGMVKAAVAERMRAHRDRALARPDARGGDHRGAARADGRRHRHLGRPHPRRQRGSDPRHGPPARRLDPAHGRARREARRRDRRRPQEAHHRHGGRSRTIRCAPRPRRGSPASPQTCSTIPRRRPRSRTGRTR